MLASVVASVCQIRKCRRLDAFGTPRLLKADALQNRSTTHGAEMNRATLLDVVSPSGTRLAHPIALTDALKLYGMTRPGFAEGQNLILSQLRRGISTSVEVRTLKIP